MKISIQEPQRICLEQIIKVKSGMNVKIEVRNGFAAIVEPFFKPLGKDYAEARAEVTNLCMKD